jgi:hypothetical protein
MISRYALYPCEQDQVNLSNKTFPFRQQDA